MDTPRSLPDGTVTFLFTDIEGSTRLLQHLGDRYAQVLADQRRQVRAAFLPRAGHELGTEGDSFFVAFASALDALTAAVAAQRAVSGHCWPEGCPVRLRMGLHTGEPTLTPEGYVGLDLHRAARICATAHGGQILLSRRTHDLVIHGLPPDVSLRDLGAHRLKDLLQPEQLFQVVAADLPADFPPLKSLDAHPNNLPLQITRFVGREREMAEIKRLLGTTRLLTLTGTGGCGKTRLAFQIAADLLEEYADGVWLVELASLANPALVPQAVASVLHLREEPGRVLTDTIVDYLRPRRLLLLLDNCEHLIGACAQLAETILRACPGVRVLATSRQVLAISGEQVWSAPSLQLPDLPQSPSTGTDPTAVASRSEAVRLFLDRAVLHQPRFALTPANAPLLAQVCQRLDGIPLAIELAAARVKLLSIEQIAARLDDRFRLLTRGSRTALPQHQTLRATMDWSYDLLTEAERSLLRRISVFAGRFTLEAAEEICSDPNDDPQPTTHDPRPTTRDASSVVGRGSWVVRLEEVLDLLTGLVNKSLVMTEEEEFGEPRYRLLETIRQYGAEKLRDSEEECLLRSRHQDWFLRLAERAEPELRGSRQGEWLDRLEREHDNLRAALEWCEACGEAELGLRLGAALRLFWVMRGYPGEARERLDHLLALPQAAARTPARARALSAAAPVAADQGDYQAAQALAEERRAIWIELGDRQGIADSLNTLGIIALEEKRAAALSMRGAALRYEAISRSPQSFLWLCRPA